jgi:hypothetical protein
MAIALNDPPVACSSMASVCQFAALVQLTLQVAYFRAPSLP